MAYMKSKLKQYDIFISYSRKDTEVVNRICKAFDEEGITYFIDRQGLTGGTEFPEKLANAILSCNKLLFVASNNSYQSKFTKNEITFAYNEKEPESIIPYIIDGSSLPPGLKLIFSGVNIRNIEEHPIETVLVDDVLSILGRERKSRREGVETVSVRKITSIKLLEELIEDFLSVKGLISLDKSDMKYLYESKEVAYSLVPIYNGSNRLHQAFESLKSSIGDDFSGYTHFFIYLKFSELDSTPMMEEMNEVNDFFSYIPEEFEIKWGVCHDGIRSEIFFILAK
jgi:hypothetical protein